MKPAKLTASLLSISLIASGLSASVQNPASAKENKIVPVQAQTTLSWETHLGTSDSDYSNGVATDSNGNIYISGSTKGPLAGANQGASDAWVAKYNSTGTLMWKQQLGTANSDHSYGVATDGNGNVYISGTTVGPLAGAKQGASDAWVAKYNSTGTLMWKQQLGTSKNDYSYGVATDSNGNVYISVATEGSLADANQGASDAWIAKYNSSGTLTWKRQLGTSSFVISNGIATDSNGNVYISGYAYGSLAGASQGGSDAWIAKYNSSGTLMWKRQLGTANDDYPSGIAIDSNGNIYISSKSYSFEGSFSGFVPFNGSLLAKYNSNGAQVWKRQFGEGGAHSESYINIGISNGLATDINGNVYYLDPTGGGTYDLRTYNSSGTLIRQFEIPFSGSTRASVAIDSQRNVYISGDMTGSELPSPNDQGIEAILIKYTQ